MGAITNYGDIFCGGWSPQIGASQSESLAPLWGLARVLVTNPWRLHAANEVCGARYESQKILAALMLTVTAPIWAQPKTFQPGEVIRADEINANFQEIYNLALGNSGSGAAEGGAPGLLWLGSGKLTAILPPDQSLLGVSCPNESQVSNRSVGQIHFIPGVCLGDCNIQTLGKLAPKRLYLRQAPPRPASPQIPTALQQNVSPMRP